MVKVSSLICGFVLTLSTMLHAEITPVAVTVDNFIRAQMDQDFRGVAEKAGGVGIFQHEREPVGIDEQNLVRMNRDTPSSRAIFDLTSPLTVVIPETDDRFISFILVSQDQYQQHLSYAPGTYIFTRDDIGTRYVFMNIRIFADPNDPDDLARLNDIQDAIQVIQEDKDTLELSNWNQEQLAKLNRAIASMTPRVPDNSGLFGKPGEVDPIRHFIATAVGPGDNKPEDAIYPNRTPEKKDAETTYILTVAEVPVDAFWSISVYNDQGFFEAPAEHASLNSVTAQKQPDGTTVMHFGGDETAANYLRIMDGWNYMVRLYRPGEDLLNGAWTFPQEEVSADQTFESRFRR